MDIHPHGFWITPNKEMYGIDMGVAVFLDQFFRGKTVVDFGCGSGEYVKHLVSKDIICEGFDGNPNTPEMSNGLCGVLDLTQNFDLIKRYDYVLSLEVGEHLPPSYEQIFINNLHKHNREGVVLSWAKVKPDVCIALTKAT